MEGQAGVVAARGTVDEQRARDRREVDQRLDLELSAARHRHPHDRLGETLQRLGRQRRQGRGAAARRRRDSRAGPLGQHRGREPGHLRIDVGQVRRQRVGVVGRTEFLQPLEDGHPRVAGRVGVERGQAGQRRQAARAPRRHGPAIPRGPRPRSSPTGSPSRPARRRRRHRPRAARCSTGRQSPPRARCRRRPPRAAAASPRRQPARLRARRTSGSATAHLGGTARRRAVPGREPPSPARRWRARDGASRHAALPAEPARDRSGAPTALSSG